MQGSNAFSHVETWTGKSRIQLSIDRILILHL
jgi:hypothetical protein